MGVVLVCERHASLRPPPPPSPKKNQNTTASIFKFYISIKKLKLLIKDNSSR
jgi:hypothetical protein